MKHVFIDESGDLGHGPKGSKYFVVCAIVVDDYDKSKIRRIPKKIRQRTLGKKSKSPKELKFSNSSPLIREQFLKRVVKHDVHIYALIIKKDYTEEKLQNNLPILYNYLMKILLENILSDINSNSNLRICLDKCMSRSQMENFENYVKTELFSKSFDFSNVEIVHKNSSCSNCLQVVDFICGAFGYKYNTALLGVDSSRYSDIIKTKIKLEKNDFFF